jgi:PAS domain S-box-containing protein
MTVDPLVSALELGAPTDLNGALQVVLDATMELHKADFGSVQLYSPENRSLEIVGQRGFRQDFLDHFRRLSSGSACAAALARRQRVIIEDVQSGAGFAHREQAAAAGFRAVQSTPLLSRGGEPLGMISTHFRLPHRPSEEELRLTDLYARQAADLIERKRAGDALRESEERFRLMVEGVKDYAIYMLDPTGRIVSWNAGAEHIKGYRADEVIGRHFGIFYTREALEQGLPDLELGLATAEGRFSDEGWRVRKDGSRFWASVVMTALRNIDGRLVGISKVTRDLSEQRRAAEQLRQADERNELILDAITDMFIAFTGDFRFAYLNHHAAQQMRLVGKDPEQLIGRLVWDEFTDVPNAPAMRRVMRERVSVTDEVHYPPLGQWYENRMYPSSDGGMVVFVRNVTQRRRSEEALRRSEAYLAEGQRIGHTGTWAWNVTTRELYWSPEHFRIVGLEPDVKPTYEGFFALVHPDDRVQVQQGFAAAIAASGFFNGEYRIVRPDGAVRFIQSAARPVLDSTGNLVEYIGTVIDATERRQAEQSVKEAREQLAHVNRALTVAELTASIAHELNQPLAAVVANASACERWLGARPPNEPEAHAALHRITRDANRAADVIARIRALLTRREPQTAELRIDELIAETLSLVDGEARSKEIALGASIEQGLPPVRADRVRIQQVLLNLLVNAMEALASAAAPRSVEVHAGRDDGAVAVHVTDSGPGIDPAQIKRVFEPFFSTKHEGMGMGLAISRSIVEEHGGRIRAMNNAERRGASFEFTLPLHT